MSALIYQCFKLSLATLYPAYASYKAVKTKNVKEYVKWMMYWVVYAFFMSVEVLADFFIAWLPFYYELKIIFVLWLLSPATKGSSILYRKLIHPQLSRRESEIDCYIEKASEQGYSTFLALGSRAVTLTTSVIVANAIKGQTKLVDHLSKSAAGYVSQGGGGGGGVEKQDGDQDGDDGDRKERQVKDVAKLQRTDSTISESSCDERESNEIIRECFQQIIPEKRPTKPMATVTMPTATTATATPQAPKELRRFTNNYKRY